MQKLGQREEQIMHIVWEMKKAFAKEIVDRIPDPKPHYNTIATMAKTLVQKGFLNMVKLGNTYQFSPKISLEEYRQQDLSSIKRKYFGNSIPKMMAHFAKNEKFSDAEIEELIRLIKSNKP